MEMRGQWDSNRKLTMYHVAQRELDSAGVLVGFGTAVDALETARSDVIATWPNEPPGGLNTSNVRHKFSTIA